MLATLGYRNHLLKKISSTTSILLVAIGMVHGTRRGPIEPHVEGFVNFSTHSRSFRDVDNHSEGVSHL